MEQWEYCVLEVVVLKTSSDANIYTGTHVEAKKIAESVPEGTVVAPSLLMEHMLELGEEGWELVSVSGSREGGWHAFLKRRVHEKNNSFAQ